MKAEPVSKEYLSRTSHSTPFFELLLLLWLAKSNYGTYWSLTSGNSNGSKSRYDYNDSNSRNYAENFMSDIQGITNNPVATIDATGLALLVLSLLL